MPADIDKIEAIRHELPATQRWTFLNVGTFGPLPRVAHRAIQELAQRELEGGRLDPALWEEGQALKQGLRAEFASLLNAQPEEIALTHHTSEGMNVGTLGIDWRSGDEALTTNVEHSAGLLPLYIVQRRFGVHVRFVDLDMGGTNAAQAIRQSLTPRTRLISLSHVSFSTGALLPLQEISALAHQRGIFVLADGAQAVGAIPTDVKQMGVDLYALPGQKWLCGPAGIGAFYVRRKRLPDLELTFGSYASQATYDHTGYFVPKAGAQRFEVADAYAPALAGQLATLRWLREEIGWDWIISRVADLASYARQLLDGLEGVRVLTPPNMAGLLHFQVEGIADLEVLVNGLSQRGILIRSVSHPLPCARVAPSFYNTEAELERLVSAIDEIRREQG
jgi:L-cysteine/cystine lyase